MKEQDKCEEAEFYYQKMQENIQTYKDFSYYLHGFLSAARTVMIYIYCNVKAKDNTDAWYVETMKNESILQKFREMRNDDIHREPIKPSGHIELSVFEVVRMPNVSLEYTVTDQDGNTVSCGSKKDDDHTQPEDRPPEVKYTYFFNDDKSDVIEMCGKCLERLKHVIGLYQTSGYHDI